MTQDNFKCGLAVMVGRTNSGKSTLLNALVGSKVSIVTDRPQTTRDTIHGVVNHQNGQIVFVDTPGFYKTSPSKLVDKLHKKAKDTLVDVDVIVHVVDPTRAPGEEDSMVENIIKNVNTPKILCLNKLDLPNRPYKDYWLEKQNQYATTVEVSGLKCLNLDALINAIISFLPIQPPLYTDQLTNATKEFIISEIIREKVYMLTSDEVPYRTEVELDSIEERSTKDGKPLLHIKAAILTPNEHYQRMLIGAGAKKIKEIGTAARKELELNLGKKVFLDIDVIVDKNILK
jgi:GTP-binding protein Era